MFHIHFMSRCNATISLIGIGYRQPLYTLAVEIVHSTVAPCRSGNILSTKE